jgi:hypothetical protein
MLTLTLMLSHVVKTKRNPPIRIFLMYLYAPKEKQAVNLGMREATKLPNASSS